MALGGISAPASKGGLLEDDASSLLFVSHDEHSYCSVGMSKHVF